MDGAKVFIGAWRTRGDCEFLVGVERGRLLKFLSDAHYRVWLVVAVNPGNLLPGLYRHSLRIEHEVFDLDCVLLVTANRDICCVVAPSGEAEIQDDEDS